MPRRSPLSHANEAKQPRSRETLLRLIDATESLLREGGLDAATVPAIAERAGVSVGVVYRRFPDKDMLLREVHNRYFQRMADANQARLQAVAALPHMKAKALLRGIILGMVQGYRKERMILRALTRYGRMHADPHFRRSAREYNRAATSAIVELLLRDRAAFDHPDPEAAIHFIVIAIASTLHTTILEEEPVHGLRTPEKFEEELVRMAFGYLGIDS